MSRHFPILFLFAFLLAACSGASGTPTPHPIPDFVPGDCQFNEPPRVEVICGTVEVPQDRTDLSRGTYELAVATLISPNPRPAPEALVYLAGGPGENALSTLEFTFESVFEPFLEDRDIVIFDQRGAGFSEPSTACTELRELAIETLNEPLAVDEASARSVVAANACHDRLVAEGVALDTLSSWESAQDVHAIMNALLYEDYFILGISYGTRLAQTVMRDRPEGVLGVILDSAVPLDADLMGEVPRSFDRALQTLFEGCSASTTCNADYPELERTLLAATDLLNASPVDGTVSHQLDVESYDAVANGVDLGEALFQALYSAELIPMLPEMITAAAEGQIGLVDFVRSLAITQTDFVSEGMQFAIQCQEEIAFSSPEAMAEIAAPHTTVLHMIGGTRSFGSELFEICDHWGLERADDIETEPVSSDIPTLVLAGSYDPITPPSGGLRVADGLTSATFLEAHAAGHAALGSSECAAGAAVAFLRAPESPVDTSCVEDDPPFQWTRPLEHVTFEPYEDSFFGVASVRPTGWTEVAPGAYTRSGLGAVMVFQQAAPLVTAADLLESLRRSFGGNELARIGTYESETLSWAVHSADAFGSHLLIAAAEAEGVTPFVLVTGLPGQEDEIRQFLLDPVLEAFRLTN